MTGESSHLWSQADELRRVVPVFALVVAIFAAVADPTTAADLILAGIPATAFVLSTEVSASGARPSSAPPTVQHGRRLLWSRAGAGPASRDR